VVGEFSANSVKILLLNKMHRVPLVIPELTVRNTVNNRGLLRRLFGLLKIVRNSGYNIGIGTGNPGVFQGYPHPYPRKPGGMYSVHGYTSKLTEKPRNSSAGVN